jgi:2-phosphosulfolactate phosphatase
MRVRIHGLLEGARAARGHVVLIDVFTSTTLVATLLARGVTCVVPVLTAREARAIQARRPDSILMGEWWGKKPPGFHHNTSAVRANELEVAGRQVVLSTTNGTLGILAAQKADRLFLACFRNAAALVRRLAHAAEVTLVPIGLAHARIRAIEDEMCAAALRSSLLGEEVDFAAIERRIRRDPSSRLRNLGRSRDVAYCLERDAIEAVPELRDGVIVAS